MGSCLSRASAGALVNPEINVTNIQCTGMGFTGVTVETTLRIYNPNFGRMDGTNITYKIRKKSDGTTLSEGDVPRQFSVNPKDTITVDLPVTFKYLGMGAAGASLVRRGETDLEVSGEITFVAPFAEQGTVKIPYKGEASIVLSSE